MNIKRWRNNIPSYMKKIEQLIYSIMGITRKLTVFTSRTLPLAGQKASEAALTLSTEEKESLTLTTIQNKTYPHLISLPTSGSSI